MDLNTLERRRDHRTHAFVPISVQLEELEQSIGAHLLDLSTGGAGIVTSSEGAPAVGEYLELEFNMPGRDGEPTPENRRETGQVVNVFPSGQGLSRIGVRFVQNGGNDAEMIDPLDLLSHHRKSMPLEALGNRWSTARHFQGLSRTPVAVN